jgi:hypothetical protein
MKHFSIALIYIAFFGLIGGACYFTSSGLPLWALIFTPQWSSKSDDE